MLRKLLEERIRQLDTRAEGFETQLRRVVRMLVLMRRCSQKTAARLLGMEPRSFARRLAHYKIEFRNLVNEVRYEISRRLISDSRLPMSQVADILGYSEASAFTRAFRRWSAMAPTSWKAEHMGDQAASWHDFDRADREVQEEDIALAERRNQ
jgi:AraC-like DNA-binding protein